MFERLFSDSLTPVLAYRCLVKEDDRDAPSFLFESVTNGDQSVRATHCGRKSSSRNERLVLLALPLPLWLTPSSLSGRTALDMWVGETMSQGRYTFLGAQPAVEVLAQGHTVTVLDHHKGSRVTTVITLSDTPLGLLVSPIVSGAGRGQGPHTS